MSSWKWPLSNYRPQKYIRALAHPLFISQPGSGVRVKFLTLLSSKSHLRLMGPALITFNQRLLSLATAIFIMPTTTTTIQFSAALSANCCMVVANLAPRLGGTYLGWLSNLPVPPFGLSARAREGHTSGWNNIINSRCVQLCKPASERNCNTLAQCSTRMGTVCIYLFVVPKKRHCFLIRQLI